MSKHSNITYTDVVVIGNGPSGISLSYMLAGNWPYYTGEIHPNEYLQLRLQDGGETSLVEQDLEYLASGLEGRSANPVALLFDTLTHPDADIGMEAPSILQWRHHGEKAIDHVVLGKMPVGGAWQMMEGGMQTLSLGNWMQLPDLPFKEWLRNYRQKVDTRKGEESPRKANRASIEEVKNYYTEYVQIKGITQYFREHTTVTTVERVLDVHHTIDDESGEQVPCSNDHCGKFKWEVRGQEIMADEHGCAKLVDFCYRAPNVVIATGTYDQPNRLKVPGEHLPYIKHSMGELERLVRTEEVHPDSHPTLVIGAGLSAADAILYAQEKRIPVAHMFRRDVSDPHIIFRNLPSLLYPEYHHVHSMMAAREQSADGYQAFPTHSVVEFKDDKKVLIRKQKKSTRDTILQVSSVLVQIGSRPNLSFLPHCGRHIGVVPGMHIDSKHNPIDIDPFTHQSIHEHGLFALGPLVGDNFVRFLRGGALAITSHIQRKRCHKL